MMIEYTLKLFVFLSISFIMQGYVIKVLQAWIVNTFCFLNHGRERDEERAVSIMLLRIIRVLFGSVLDVIDESQL